MLIFKCNQFWSLNVTEHDPDYWAKDEELRLALVAAGEEFDYKVQNAKILLIHKVRHESLCCIMIFQDRAFMPILKLVGWIRHQYL